MHCLSCCGFSWQVVKVADFGVARVKAQSGVMTAETGTYRWMAPEVIPMKFFDVELLAMIFASIMLILFITPCLLFCGFLYLFKISQSSSLFNGCSFWDLLKFHILSKGSSSIKITSIM